MIDKFILVVFLNIALFNFYKELLLMSLLFFFAITYFFYRNRNEWNFKDITNQYSNGIIFFLMGCFMIFVVKLFGSNNMIYEIIGLKTLLFSLMIACTEEITARWFLVKTAPTNHRNILIVISIVISCIYTNIFYPPIGIFTGLMGIIFYLGRKNLLEVIRNNFLLRAGLLVGSSFEFLIK